MSLTHVFLNSINVGDVALKKRGVLTSKCTLITVIVTNWDDMKKIGHGIFNELRFAPEERHVFAHESSLEPQGLPRAHDTGHVQEVQRARHVHGDPKLDASS